MACISQIFLHKQLARNEAFVECKTSNCGYGWLVAAEAKKEDKKCEACNVKQVGAFVCSRSQRPCEIDVWSWFQSVERKKEELDAEFKKMIATGVLRPCPKCQHMTMKEKGTSTALAAPRPLTSAFAAQAFAT